MGDGGDPERLILPEPTHVGFVTHDIKRAMAHLQQYFGIGAFTEMTPDYSNKRCYGEPEDFQTQLAFARVGNMVYELIQVLRGRTIYQALMKEHGEGIHHLGYEVSDLARWAMAYKAVGIEPIMSGERIGLKWAYFDTPEIIVELLERTPEGRVV